MLRLWYCINKKMDIFAVILKIIDLLIKRVNDRKLLVTNNFLF